LNAPARNCGGWGSIRKRKRRLSAMRTNGKKLCIPGTLLLILLTASACSTAPQGIRTADPALDFPAFPDPLGPDGRPVPALEGDAVKIPLWYWLKITEYVVDAEKVREQYEAWRRVYFEEGEKYE
jgi:hypothetical protein